MKYLIACPACGNNIPVETSQAGQVIACSCGRQIDVPSIRALRQLQPVPETETVQPAAWSKRKGVLFLGGAILAIAALAGAIMLLVRPSTAATNLPPVEIDSKAVQQEINSLGPDESFIRLTLMQPWPPKPFSERLQKSEVPVELLASAELISRFEGPGQQFLASGEALKAAQKASARNSEIVEAFHKRQRINEWLSTVAVLGGIGLIVAGSAIFLSDGTPREPRTGKSAKRNANRPAGTGR